MSDSFVQASCASAAAVFSTTTLYPLEITKARLVTEVGEKAKHRTSLAILLGILRKDGVLGLYQGLGAKCMHGVVQTFGFYYIYTFLVKYIKRTSGKTELGTLTNLGVGYLAGVGNLAASLPFEVITMRAQTSKHGVSFLQAIAQLYTDGGLPAFYRGLYAAVLLCINPAIYNTVFDQLKSRWLARITRATGKKVVALTTLQAFLLGVIAKAVATVLTYPYIRAKMVMQAAVRPSRDAASNAEAGSAGDGENKGRDPDSDDDTAAANMTALGVMEDIVRREGVQGLFKGIKVQLLRSTLSSALMLMAKERVYFYTRKLLRGVAKA